MKKVKEGRVEEIGGVKGFGGKVGESVFDDVDGW